MPPTCSCATTAAPAAAAGVAFLHGLTPQQINDMLCTAQVQMAGVVCDGAKPSCATRMYVALFGSLQAMMMAKEGIRATNVEGFVHNDLKVRVLHALVVAMLRLQTETMAGNKGASNILSISDEDFVKYLPVFSKADY